MPKKSIKFDSEKIVLSESGVAAVDKALTILKLFGANQQELSLIDISAQTGLYKSTILRMMASLENALLIIKKQNGRYTLGPTIANLYSAYQYKESLNAVITPVLQNLMLSTNESAAFHVRDGDVRLCLLRVDSNQALRDHIKVGDLLPMDKGAGGKVLRAFEGSKGKIFDAIRKDMVLALQGDRVKEISGISAPVFNKDGLLGVITLTMPTYRFNPKQVQQVKSSAKKLTQILGGQFKY